MEIRSDEYKLIEDLAAAASESPVAESMERLAQWRNGVPADTASAQVENCHIDAHISNCNVGS
jgi:hypothetical protein